MILMGTPLTPTPGGAPVEEAPQALTQGKHLHHTTTTTATNTNNTTTISPPSNITTIVTTTTTNIIISVFRTPHAEHFGQSSSVYSDHSYRHAAERSTVNLHRLQWKGVCIALLRGISNKSLSRIQHPFIANRRASPFILRGSLSVDAYRSSHVFQHEFMKTYTTVLLCTVLAH